MTQKWFAPGEKCPDGENLRMEVFVAEQHVPSEEEIDELDNFCWHLVLYDGQMPVATGRLVNEGDNVWHPGRIAVKNKCRGKGIGAELVRALIAKGSELGAKKLNLVAQCHAEGFYERCGFVSLHEHCMDAGILHVKMQYLYE
jgi:predicted GNAT family N-acyltransferase